MTNMIRIDEFKQKCWVRPGFELGSSRDAEPLDDYN